METELIIKSIMGLIAVLAILVFFLFLEPNKKSQKKSNKQKTADENKVKTEVKSTITNTDLNHLLSIIKNKKSSTELLGEALDMVIKYHGRVHTKLGLRSHPDFDIYMGIIFTACRHPNITKDLIIKFDKELTRLNPEYKQDINEALTKGLTSRRV
ncbi:MAG: hypothetical protein OQK48_02400 [Sulfurimonas sp.]|uniref:hypothetical protein n=1 Tax=Sulfurimonas sp. TaxID=2022749 RepID=UPI00262FD628|nr:hypothetical protein [Sulfurimonas sp.]MCW8894568.1 hypothetical protein [Sulfurimonas sp.]MCW8953774.1 hypothetical protein [Sulfurimonas sp.]MCW9067520.1 hypothetical protein [Sulfurimonas sp.]